jgi:hypothetical protein
VVLLVQVGLPNQVVPVVQSFFAALPDPAVLQYQVVLVVWLFFAALLVLAVPPD